MNTRARRWKLPLPHRSQAPRRISLGVVLLALLLAGCSPANDQTASSAPAARTIVAAAPSTASPTLLPTVVPPTAPALPASPTASPTATATAEPTVTPTPDPVAAFTIPALRERFAQPAGGEVTIGDVWNRATGYTSYRISYPVEDLRLTGLLHVPDGDGPFPVIIANRGTIARDIYQPGMDSRAFSDYMASRGYLVVAPDFRGYAGGDDGPNEFYTGYYADVLGLIPLAQRLPMAQPGKVGMWGHSRGAAATVAALTVSDQIAAAVVYAPAPADLAQDYARRLRQSGGNPGSATWPFPPDQNPEAYARVSPINYFDQISAPVMLHHGAADTTVDVSASVAIADALRAAGKDVTLHVYEGGGHTLMGAAEELYFVRTLEFFRRHLP